MSTPHTDRMTVATDVVAGWLIGLAWGLSVVVAHRVWPELRGHARVQIRHL